jgi:hypothetical protein
MRARRTSWTGVASPTTGSWESGGENQARPSRAFSDDYVLVGALLLLTGVRMSAYGHSPDPRVAYASFWGGSGAEGREPTVGRDGSIYVTWGTDSPNLPRIGRGSRPYQGQEDGYIAKLDRTGTRIIYATYLGSPGNDEIDSAAVDASGHLYVTGFATDGFPTTPGALDPTFNGAADCCDGLVGDAFIAKLSTDGSRLLYSAFLGGSGADRTSTLALGRDGSVTVSGFTGSANFPTTNSALQSTFSGGSATFEEVPVDAFAAKLNPSGSRLVYSTFSGGSGDDVGNGVVLDHGGNAYYTGLSNSPDFPTTPGTLKPAYGTPPPELNGFVTKLSAAGRMIWSTHLGGPNRDSARGIDVDAHHDVYVSGSTIGGFPVTAGAAQATFGGVRDWFVAKLDRSGASLTGQPISEAATSTDFPRPCGSTGRVTWTSSGRPPQPISRQPATPSKPPTPARSTSPSCNSIAAGACCSPPTSAVAARRTAPAYRRRSTRGATSTSVASRPHPTSPLPPMRSSRHTAAETSTACRQGGPCPLDEDRPLVLPSRLSRPSRQESALPCPASRSVPGRGGPGRRRRPRPDGTGPSSTRRGLPAP